MPKKEMYTSTFTFQGKRMYVRSKKSQRDADRKAEKKKLELENGLNIITSSTSVYDYCIQWVDTYKKPIVEHKTYLRYIGYINNYINPLIGNLKISQVKPIHLQQVLNSNPGRSKDFYEKLKNALDQIFKQARRDKLIIDVPSDGLSIPKSENGTNRSIIEAERKAILKVAETHYAGLWVKLMLYCGLRPQETALIGWKDVDVKNKRLKITKAIDAYGNAKTPKTEAGIRSIPINSILWEELKKHKEDEFFIVRPKDGKRINRDIMRKMWSDFAHMVDIELGAEILYKKDGTPKLGAHAMPVISKSVIAKDLLPYCLRHTFCTDLEAAGVPINVAKYLMGHSNISITAKIYSHIREDILEDAAEKMDSFSATGATLGATPTLYK